MCPREGGVALPVWRRCLVRRASGESVTTSWSSRCCWHQRRSSRDKVGGSLLVCVWRRAKSRQKRQSRGGKDIKRNFSSDSLARCCCCKQLWITHLGRRAESVCLVAACVCLENNLRFSAESGFRISAPLFWEDFSSPFASVGISSPCLSNLSRLTRSFLFFIF